MNATQVRMPHIYVPKEMWSTIELRINHILRKTGITKARAFSALTMFHTPLNSSITTLID